MSIAQIFNLLGFPALISSIVLLLLNRHFSKKDKNEENIKKKDTDVSNLQTTVGSLQEEHLKYNKIIEENRNSIGMLSLGIQALLRDRIVRMYNSYARDKGFFPITARESLKNMYEQYHNLGGNGVVTDLVNRLYELPIEPPEDYNGPYGE